RTLERLEELGIVRHLHLGHGAGVYGLARGERDYLAGEADGRVSRQRLRVTRRCVRPRRGRRAAAAPPLATGRWRSVSAPPARRRGPPPGRSGTSGTTA